MYNKISEREFEEIRATHKYKTPAEGNQLTAHLLGMHWRKQFPEDGNAPVLYWQWREEWPNCVYFKSSVPARDYAKDHAKS